MANRLRGLDALRGAAATLVLVAHMLGQLGKDGHAWAVSALASFDLGTFGVVLFFLISGFVIPFSLQRGLTAFGISRAARLLPALWLSMAFCLALGTPLEGTTQLFANAFMVAPALGQETLSGPYWTLSWELYFYCIVAAAFAMGWAQLPRTFGLLSIAAATIASLNPPAVYLIYMFVGALLRMAILDKTDAAGWWLSVALSSLAGVCYMWTWIADPSDGYLLALIVPVPLFILLWNRLTHPALLWLGRVSYSLYLFNLPVVVALSIFGLAPAAFIAASAGLSLLIAAVVYRWVEQPIMDQGKAWSRRLSARPAGEVRSGRTVPAGTV